MIRNFMLFVCFVALLFRAAVARAQLPSEWCKDFTPARGGPADVTGQGVLDIDGNPIDHLGACPLAPAGPAIVLGSALLLLFGAAPLHAQATFDIGKSKMSWYWTPAAGAPNADQFNIKCGRQSGNYTRTTIIPTSAQPYNPREIEVKDATDGASFGVWFCAVTAVAGGVEGAPSVEVGVTLLPAAPSGLSAVALSNSVIQLAWVNNDATSPQTIKVERKYQVSGEWLPLTFFSLNNFYRNTNLLPNRTYCYRIRTAIGEFISLYSNETCVRTPN